MSDVSRTGSALTMPSDGYSTQDYEQAKFSVSSGVASVNTNMTTLLAGEDLTNNVIKTENRFSYYTSFGTALGTVKASAGYLHNITVLNPMMFGAAGTISLWDNTAASGTSLGTITIPAGTVGQPFTINFDEVFLNGLVLSFGGTSLPYLNISYR